MKREIDKIAGAVIDPATGRYCALARDVAASLGIGDSSVRHAAQRGGVAKYQGRYYDLPQILAALGNRRKPGNPNGWQHVLTAEAARRAAVNTIGIIIAGITLAGAALLPLTGGSKPEAKNVAPAAVWQNQTVALAAELGLAQEAK